MTRLPNAAPKPPRRRKRRRQFSSIARPSLAEARAAERKLRARSSPPRERNPKRRQSEFTRTYHSRAFVRWVKAKGCWACARYGTARILSQPIDPAHTATGGGSYKADWDTIAPLCRCHHTLFDEWLGRFADVAVRELVKAFAAQIAAEWRAIHGG